MYWAIIFFKRCYMADNRLSLNYQGSVANIRFDDGKANALDNDWFSEMLRLLDEVESSTATCLVLTGREGIFSGGLNIKWLPTMARAEEVAFWQLFPGVMKRIYHYPKPTIAEVTGHAIAGGCILACACDRRVARADMSIGMNEVRVNMTIPEWAIDIVMDAIPEPQVSRMLKFGETVSTNQLSDWQVFDSMAQTPQLLAQAVADLAETFTGISLPDFAGTKQRVRRTLR